MLDVIQREHRFRGASFTVSTGVFAGFGLRGAGVRRQRVHVGCRPALPLPFAEVRGEGREGARWAYHDDVVRIAAAFRPAPAERRSAGHLPGQRVAVRRCVAAARLRRPRHQADPLPAD
jgi:hypothetical protein